jgi:hypothetical protein
VSSHADAEWLSGTSLPRVLGGVTVAYSAAIIVRTKLLARSCGFADSRGEVPREVAMLIAAVGARDVASGLAMALVPAGKPLLTALAVRVAADSATFSRPLISAVPPTQSLRLVHRRLSAGIAAHQVLRYFR